MSTRLQLDIYRTRLVVNQDKLYYASQSVIFWALSELSNKNNHFIKINQQGAVAEFPVELSKLDNNTQISGEMYDLQSRFNMNNVVDKKYISMFMNLIHQVNDQATGLERVTIALAAKHWIADYNPNRGSDTFSAYYLSLKPPFYPAHQPFKSSSELRLIKNVDSSLFMSLQPFITALPETTSININTASKTVLSSLGDGLSESQVNELIQARADRGISNLREVSELMKKLNLPNDEITIDSHYFLVIAKVKNDEFELMVYCLLKRSIDKKGKLSIHVIREAFNTM